MPSEAKPQPDGTAKAAMLPSTPLWPRGKPILVHLLNDAVDSNGAKVEKSELLAPDKWNIKENQIFKWAKRWKYGSIPKFEKSENPDSADILVQLNGKLYMIMHHDRILYIYTVRKKVLR